MAGDKCRGEEARGNLFGDATLEKGLLLRRGRPVAVDVLVCDGHTGAAAVCGFAIFCEGEKTVISFGLIFLSPGLSNVEDGSGFRYADGWMSGVEEVGPTTGSITGKALMSIVKLCPLFALSALV